MSLTRARYGGLVQNRPSLQMSRLAARGVAALARAAARNARFDRSRSNRQSSSGARASPTPLTGNFDYKTDYSKRRRSRRQRRLSRRKRKWSRSVVNTVRKTSVATTHIVRRSLAQLTNTAGQSAAVSYGLNGLNGTALDTFNTTNDIGEIFRELDPTSWANTNVGATSDNYKIYTMGSTMEMTLRNTGNTDAIVEAYFIRGRKPMFATAYSSPTDVYNIGFNKQRVARNPDAPTTQFDQALAFTTLGSTPFQNSVFSGHFNIFKRQKFRIPPQNEISFIVRDPRPHTFTMVDSRTYSTDRRYTGVLFQQQGAPDASVAGSETMSQSSSVTYLSVRRYRMKLMPNQITSSSVEVSGV